jgi:hypothetical protein
VKELEGHGKYFICNTTYLSQKMNSNSNIPFTASQLTGTARLKTSSVDFRQKDMDRTNGEFII